jgi:hypothetical protein
MERRLVTTPRMLEQLQRDLSLSTNELAGVVRATPRTVKRWQESETYPQHVSRQRLDALIALDNHLGETFETPEAARSWLEADNRHLGGLTPADAIRAGRIDRVEAALEALDSGIFV